MTHSFRLSALACACLASLFLSNASAQIAATVLNWFARMDNLSDQLAYSASSILTSTAFGKSPLPGRSFKLGVQATF